MNAIKERLFGAITVMNDSDAERLWKTIISTFSSEGWDDIETVCADQCDIEMLSKIKDDPDCNEFISSDVLKKELKI